MQSNLYPIQTERLTIARFQADDLAAFSMLIRDKAASPFSVYDEPFPTDDAGLRQLLMYFIGTDEFLAVRLTKENRLIGFVSLNRVDEHTRNLGYCIHSAYQGRGYATEAARAMIGFMRSAGGITRMISGTAAENPPSVRVLERLGFALTGQQTGSFHQDESGKPITFTGCSYELKLNRIKERGDS